MKGENKYMEMNYCMVCGNQLHLKHLEGEGEIPYCDKCGDYRFPVFNTAVSMIITTKKKSRILLIKQAGKDEYVLCAGYVKKGEDAEDAVARELREELGLEAQAIRFNRSHYYKPTNTLMLNYTVIVGVEDEPIPNEEVDSWKWFMKGQSILNIKRDSLAQKFLVGYLDGGEYEF